MRNRLISLCGVVVLSGLVAQQVWGFQSQLDGTRELCLNLLLQRGVEQGLLESVLVEENFVWTVPDPATGYYRELYELGELPGYQGKVCQVVYREVDSTENQEEHGFPEIYQGEAQILETTD